MPAGCEFICDNKECKQYRSGFNIKGVWPIGNIALIINSSGVKSNAKFREKLILLKDSGRQHACVTLPNIDEVPVLGYRFSRWCDKCSCIWDDDVLFTEEERNGWENRNKVPDDWFDNVSLSYVCPTCNGQLKSFDTVTQDGIFCPFCKKELQQSRWFSNY